MMPACRVHSHLSSLAKSSASLCLHQVHEADERVRVMEKALDRLSSEKRTEEERRRELEAQLVQMVRRTSVTRPADDTSSAAEESSSADELLDPQLCRRLQQLLAKLHSEGLQVCAGLLLFVLYTGFPGAEVPPLKYFAMPVREGSQR